MTFIASDTPHLHPDQVAMSQQSLKSRDLNPYDAYLCPGDQTASLPRNLSKLRTVAMFSSHCICPQRGTAVSKYLKKLNGQLNELVSRRFMLFRS